MVVNCAGTVNDRFGNAGLVGFICEFLLVTAFRPRELQDVLRAHVAVPLRKRVGIQEIFDTLAGIEARMVAALGADMRILRKLCQVDHFLAACALFPKFVRHLRLPLSTGQDAKAPPLILEYSLHWSSKPKSSENNPDDIIPMAGPWVYAWYLRAGACRDAMRLIGVGNLRACPFTLRQAQCER